MPRSYRAWAVPITLVMAIACSSAVDPSREARPSNTAHTTTSQSTTTSTLAIAPGTPGATSTFTGIVVGKPTSGNPVLVGSAVISVWRGDITSGADSTGQWHWDSLGTLTAASNGKFTLTSLPASSYYYLKVQPPASSPFAPDVFPFAIAEGQTLADSIAVYPK